MIVIVDTTVPAAPSILTPFIGQDTGTDLTPTFTWAAPESGCSYRLEVDDPSNYGSTAIDVTTAGDVATYTPASDLEVSSTAPVGRRYYARVRATDGADNEGPWSATRYANVGRLDADFNGDGYSDLLIGATGAGAAYVYFGGSGSLETTADVTMTQENASDAFGMSVASAADVSADGYADIVVGAYGASSWCGQAILSYGGSTPFSSTVTLTGAASGS